MKPLMERQMYLIDRSGLGLLPGIGHDAEPGA
jgi:hypothetical protein